MISKQTAPSLCGLAVLWLHTVRGLGLNVRHSEDIYLDDGFEAWDGSDDASFQLDASSFTDKPHYVLLAPMDSGSNLLEHMIEANWPRQFRATSSNPEIVWKHSLASPKELYRHLAFNMPTHRLKDTHFIAVVRSPISQVVSWRNAPYDLAPCVRRDPSLYTHRCTAQLHLRKDGELGQDFETYPPIDFNSTMEVYNKYLSFYRQVLAEGEFKSAQIIQYEQMVLSPGSVLQRISEAFGVRAPLRPRAVNDPAKPTDRKMVNRPNGHEAALHKLETRAYLHALDNEVVKALCAELDRSLVQGLVESERITYTHDCD